MHMNSPDSPDKVSRQPLDVRSASVPRGEVHVVVERCKECSYCIAYCPAKVLEYSEDTNSRGYHYPLVVGGGSADCVLCKFCDLICPEFAIYTTEPGATKEGG